MALTYVVFAVVLLAFCGASYLEVVKSRLDQVPTKVDFLAALLPLVCIPALLSLCCGFYKWLVNSNCFSICYLNFSSEHLRFLDIGL